MSFAAPWMDLETVIFFLIYFILFYFLTLHYCIGFAIYQNEFTTGIQTEKDKYHMISLVFEILKNIQMNLFTNRNKPTGRKQT